MLNDTSQLLVGGLLYGTTVAGIDGLKSKAQDGYIFNSNSTIGNRYSRSLDTPINFSEGTTIYFSAIVIGTKRANFGLCNVTTGAFPDTLISVGLNPQLFSNIREKNMAESFNSSVWLGSASTMQKGDANAITVAKSMTATRLMLGRLVNNPGAADEISYHVIDLSGNVEVPSVWVSSLLAGEDGFYSKTDYNFGGDQIFSNLVINLQNNSGLDEIYIGTSYADVVPVETVKSN